MSNDQATLAETWRMRNTAAAMLAMTVPPVWAVEVIEETEAWKVVPSVGLSWLIVTVLVPVAVRRPHLAEAPSAPMPLDSHRPRPQQQP